MTSILCVKPTN